MTDPTQPAVKAQLIQKHVTAIWPLNNGQGVEFAQATAVTLTPAGYVVEFGRFLFTGLAHRSQQSMAQISEIQEMDVVARVLISPQTAKDLVGFLQTRLRDDGHYRAGDTAEAAS